MKIKQIYDSARCRWQQFRTWQIGDCKDPAGMGDKRLGKEFWRGTMDSAIPVFSGETANTILHLVFRPGYMMREYLRGKHERILSPMTALIIFFAFMMVLNNMVGKPAVDYAEIFGIAHERMESEEVFSNPELEHWFFSVLDELRACYQFMHLDQYPDLITNHTRQVLAGLESWLRAQGVFTFLHWMVLLMLGLWTVGHRRYHLSLSAAAMIGAYMLCQLCIYDFLFTLFTLGEQTSPIWLIIGLLWINLYQLIGTGWKQTTRYTILLTLVMGLYWLLTIGLFAGGLAWYAYHCM